MSRSIHRRWVAALLLSALPFVSPSYAQDSSNLSSMTASADLVFQGRVTGVDYRMLSAGNNGRALPFTFVRYQISRVIRGETSTRTITLRFLGGSDGQGRFLDVSDTPKFQVGDEDVLFVQNNGSNCPLVQCIDGRFRVLKGQLHDGQGSPVSSVADDHVVSGGTPPEEFLTFKYPAPSFDNLVKNPDVVAALQRQGISIDDARAQYNADMPREIEVKTVVSQRENRRRDASGSPKEATSQSDVEQTKTAAPMDVNAFLDVVRVRAASAPAPRAVMSADVTATPSVSTRPEAPAPQPRTSAPMKSQADIEEEARQPKDEPVRSKAR